MSFNVLILPKADAVKAARAAAARVRVPADASMLHLFCDASFKKGNPIRRTNSQAALAIVGNIWPPKAITCRRTTRGCFIPSNDPQDTNIIAEAFAVAERVHLAIKEIAGMEESYAIGPTDKIEIFFWSDCKGVLKEWRHGVRASWHLKRFRHIIDIIELTTRQIQRLRENVSVHFVWCPQECVEPHKTADELSKHRRVCGGGSESKALRMFRRLPHGNIQSALTQLYGPREDASQSEATQSTDMSTSIPHTTDEYQIIHSALGHLAVRQRDMMVVAIKLQEMVNSLRTEDQDHESAGQEYNLEDQSVNPQGQNHEQDGSLDEDEDQFHDAQETVDVEDEDKFYDAQEQPAEGGDGNVELAMAGEAVGRPSRTRALWNWIRRRPRL